MVTKLDRCSRNSLEFLKLQDALFKRNVTFVALDLPNYADLANNRLLAPTLSGIAKFENNRRKERQRQGIQAAKEAAKEIRHQQSFDSQIQRFERKQEPLRDRHF